MGGGGTSFWLISWLIRRMNPTSERSVTSSSAFSGNSIAVSMVTPFRSKVAISAMFTCIPMRQTVNISGYKVNTPLSGAHFDMSPRYWGSIT